MKQLTLFCGAALLAWVASAQAHTHLRGSTPADGSTLTASPPAIVLKFSEAARLTAAWVQRGTEPQQKLAPLPDKPSTEITISLPTLVPGRYTISWRALSDDGHVMPGQVRFTLTTPGASRASD